MSKTLSYDLIWMLVLLYKMYNKSKDKIVSKPPSAVKKTLINHPKVV